MTDTTTAAVPSTDAPPTAPAPSNDRGPGEEASRRKPALEASPRRTGTKGDEQVTAYDHLWFRRRPLE